MEIKLTELASLAQKDFVKNKEFFARLKKRPPRKLDDFAQKFHDEVFSDIDCLSCANCCKTLGPRISDKDIERLSGQLRIKPSEFSEMYLRIDEDKDYVFKTMPCPFLDSENYCAVYSERPTACRNYPHTDRKKFFQLLDITLKNTFTCPAVYEIVALLRKNL